MVWVECVQGITNGKDPEISGVSGDVKVPKLKRDPVRACG